MSYLIRDAQPDDAEIIANVHIATWQSAYRGILPAAFLSALSDDLTRRVGWWRERVASSEPRSSTLVAEEGGRVIGFADIGPSRDPDADPLQVAELAAIYVLPHASGRGVGQALMAELLRRLGRAPFGAATLWVLEENQRARRYYEAAGWTVDGSVKDESIGDVAVREVRYRIGLRNQS